ncbi:sugar phosphate isomerase/epimerase family protein [Pseudomonas sp. JZ134]|uniref:sugar phosphate isomerase/epimerase family protein n=1 Tax=Pseudomonas sp. JZ134 TaxID=2806615 RepID=UPI003DA19BA8
MTGYFRSLLAIITVSAGVTLSASAQNIQSLSDPVALQMYTLRNAGTLEEQFALARRTGFEAVEVVGNQGVSAAELRRLLARYNLSVTSSHEQFEALRNRLEETISFNKAIGNRMLVMPYLAPEDRPTDRDGWRTLGQELDRIGSRLRKEGMRLAYHNHDFEMKKYGSRTALEWMVDATRPDNLYLELDVAWVSRGGQDPVRLLNKYTQRIFAIHAKDNAGIGVRNDEMNFAPVDEGLLSWNQIIPAALRSRTQWYIVEHDLPKDPASIITTSRKNLLNELMQARHQN